MTTFLIIVFVIMIYFLLEQFFKYRRPQCPSCGSFRVKSCPDCHGMTECLDCGYHKNCDCVFESCFWMKYV